MLEQRRAVELLLSAAFDAPDTARNSWIEFTSIYSLDDAPGWAMPLLPAISTQIAKEPEPVPDSARLAGLRRREWYKGELQAERYKTATEQLRGAGISVTAHGGLATAHLWPDRSARTLDDARLVVHPSDGVAALKVLQDAGFTAPDCSVPAWHDHLDVVGDGDVTIRLSCWVLGPRAVNSAAELAWRATFDAAQPNPVDLFIASAGRHLLTPADGGEAALLSADARCALAADDFDFDALAARTRQLRLGAIVGHELESLGATSPALGRGGSGEFWSWRRGRSKVQQLWHHPRLAAAVERRFSPMSYLDYRQHLASHGVAGSPRI